MIDPAITQQVRMDYYNSDDQNTLQIVANEADLFWTWFGNEAVRLHVPEHQNYIIQDAYHIGQCFSNAQNEAITNGLPYYEGFILINNHNYLHAFNSLNGQVHDVTALNQPAFFQDINDVMPTIYHGIYIPQDFIMAHDPGNGCLLRLFFIASQQIN